VEVVEDVVEAAAPVEWNRRAVGPTLHGVPSGRSRQGIGGNKLEVIRERYCSGRTVVGESD